MLKRYPFGIFVFLLLALLATLFPPYQWGNERLRTQRDRQKSVEITATVTGEPTPRGASAQLVFPIQKRDFIFGNSWSKIQVGWGWEVSPESDRCDSLRAAFYDSVFYRSKELLDWLVDEPFEQSMTRPSLRSKEVADYFYRKVALTWLRPFVDSSPDLLHEPSYRNVVLAWSREGFAPPSRGKFFEQVAATRNRYFRYRDQGFAWLNGFRRKYPEYGGMSDSAFSRYVVDRCPSGFVDDQSYRQFGLALWDFSKKMDIDSSRQALLRLYSQLRFVSKDSLTFLNAELAPAEQKYYSPKQYDYLHRQLDLGGLFLDYLIALLAAAILEAGRYFVSLLKHEDQPSNS